MHIPPRPGAGPQAVDPGGPAAADVPLVPDAAEQPRRGPRTTGEFRDFEKRGWGWNFWETNFPFLKISSPGSAENSGTCRQSDALLHQRIRPKLGG